MHLLDYFAQHGFAAHAVNLRVTGTARDGKNCAGPELPITSKMSHMRFGNCPARPHPQSLLDALLAKALMLAELQVLDMAG